MSTTADAPRYWTLGPAHELIPTNDIQVWGRLFEDNDARTVKAEDIDGCWVSTVFLGVDHSWGEGPPLLFETMVFRGHLDERQWRYSTWDEAAAGHERIVAAVRDHTEPDAD